MKSRIFFSFATLFLFTQVINAQTAELQASSKVIVDDGYDHAELAVTPWGGSHGLFFGAKIQYKGTDHLWSSGNAVYASDPGQYDYGAYSMGYIANGGPFAFYEGGRSTGAGNPISWNAVMAFSRGGNVGIGTTNPQAKFDVNGEILGRTYLRVGAMPTSPDGQFRVLGQQGVGAVEAATNRTAFLYADQGYYGLSAYDYNARVPVPLTIGFEAANTFLNPNGGNVGIGTTNPQAKLAVNGDIISKKVKVTQTGWADYVFEPTYKLPPLTEVEAFIQQHKHLPDMPSAKEVEKNGLDVGDNQAVLLKKIEELTLYMIELKKENEQIKQELHQLKQTNQTTSH